VKKLLISALVAVMVLGLGTTAFADAGDIAGPAFSDIAGHDAEGALTLLGAMGVYEGEYGLGETVNPDDPITRAQFCKVVVEAFGRGSTAEGLMGLEPTFADEIPTWAWGYVTTAGYMGVIKGYDDGTFGPNNFVTYGEAVTMLVRAVSGHAQRVPEGVWPYNFLFYAVDNGFTGDVDVGFANLPATRGDIARLLVETMQVEGFGAEDSTIPAQLYPIAGTVTDFDADTIWIDDDDDATGDPYSLADPVYLVGADDYEGLLNNDVWAVGDTDGVFFIALAGEADVVTGVFEELADADEDSPTSYDTIVLADGTEVPFEDGGTVTATLNEEEGIVFEGTDTDGIELTKGDELVIYLGEGGKAINIVATRFETLDYITKVTPSEEYDPEDDTTWTEIVTGGDTYTIPATCRVTINGETKTPDDLAQYDAIEVALSGITNPEDPFVIRACREVVEGTIEGLKTEYPGPVYKVTIDDTTYVLNEAGGVTYGSLGVGDKVNFGLDFDGNIYVGIGYETLAPYGVCLSYSEDISGTTPVYTATFDIRGNEVTYKLDASVNPDTWVDSYVYLEVDAGTGTVDVANSSLIDVSTGTSATVLAADAANGTMTLKYNGTVVFVDDADLVVYELVDGEKVYIGLEGVVVDGTVEYIGDGAGEPTEFVFEFTAPTS